MAKQIPTLEPDAFKRLLMAEVDHSQLNKTRFNEFFIHDLSKDSYKLKLPLPPHRKTVNDFILVTGGSMIKSAGVDFYEVPKNAICILPAGQITSTTNISADFEGYYVHFANSFLSEHAMATNIYLQFPFLEWLHNPVILLTNAEVNILKQLLSRLETIYTTTPNYALIQTYLCTFLTELKQFKQVAVSAKTTASERISFGFKRLLSQFVTKKHDAIFYASQLHISANHLNKCVKEVFGKSASQIITEYLLLEAQVLLQQPSLSINEISFAIGFDDPSYFGRFFKKNTGETPSNYRKLIHLSD